MFNKELWYKIIFGLVKKVFISLLSFSGSFETKRLSLNNEPCMTRPTLIDLNPLELNYHLLMVSLDKCHGSCNAVDDLFTKKYAPSKIKNVNVEVVNVIIRINEIKNW